MGGLLEISKKAFTLKAYLAPVTNFHLLTTNLQYIQEQLKVAVEETPFFFKQLPVILDLSYIPISETNLTIQFPLIIHCLRSYSLIPIGIRGGGTVQQTLAIQSGLALFSTEKKNTMRYGRKKKEIASTAYSKLITQPVRSGQQIYAKNSDLIVTAPVSSGAELLADGSIHVYNRLKGRALAGVRGNQEAHIFCQHLEAELVAIAGHYWLSDDLLDLKKSLNKGSLHISFQQERLQIESLA